MRYKLIMQLENNSVELFYNYDFKKRAYESICDMLLTYPNIVKIDILDFFELSALCYYCDTYNYRNKFEIDELFWEIPESIEINDKTPTYTSEYINIIGQLFLAGYIDFGTLCDNNKDRIDYPTNLSYYKEDKYQAWIYFRDNFFYKDMFHRKFDHNFTDIEMASWDKPQDWCEYNIWVARTPKGDKYFNEILAPRFYNKYKDLEVEIDSNGNIIAWYKNGVKI